MLFVDIAAGIIIGALAGLGVGGGGLLVIYLTLVRHTEQLNAQGINLVFFIFAAFSSLLFNIKKRRLDFKTLILLSVSGAAFAVLGSFCASAVDSSTVRVCFGWLLIISGAAALFGWGGNRG